MKTHAKTLKSAVALFAFAFLANTATAQFPGTPYIVPQQKEPEVPPVDVGDIASSNYHWVGAFWRWNQTAERLIRWRNPSGIKWEAHVIHGKDFIRLDKQMTKDPNVGWLPGNENTNDAGVLNGNDETNFDNNTNYRLPTTAGTAVDGTGTIYFRIGLTDNLGNSTSAPRYGVVHLTHGDTLLAANRHDIYIRQGEEPDILYPTRDEAVAFSPYNLTDPNHWTVTGSTGVPNVANNPNINATTGAAFVDYPTQAGAYFVWSYNRAFHPVNPVNGFTLGTWYQDYVSPPGTPNPNGVSDTWDSGAMDVCPGSYRYPTDNASQSTSEMRRSLYKIPQPGTDISTGTNNGFLFGYYADGFFDRRRIKTSPSFAPVSTVSYDNANPANAINVNIAYLGVLFYNDDGTIVDRPYRSLFFPATGSRLGNANGSLGGNGNQGNYLSSSTVGTATNTDLNLAWTMFTGGNGSTAAAQTNQNRHVKREASSVRCVRP
ncbi:MAG: hypothetical protein LBE36_07535 [Flavobacteriaceae bacterium]|jgi:hypothetical protein|nr:hypothetical protein [Flavobacteriaceae bacterium]